jgi:AcrR family transcriptional regulator
MTTKAKAEKIPASNNKAGKTSLAGVKPDGRIQRSARSRQIIIDAMLALVNDGVLIPTAQQVADRAGVAIRTVFRHFDDMEALYAEVDATLRPVYEGMFLGMDRSGTLAERVLHAVECHANAYEHQALIHEMTTVMLWRSETVSQVYARNQRNLRKNLEQWLPELKQVSKERREAIDAVTSFEFFSRLQKHQGLSKKACIKLIVNLVTDLL